jgi:cell division protein FtsL
MASIATVYNRLLGAKADSDTFAHSAVATNDDFVLRSLPNEEIYFFVKDIDNGRVVRQADPQARGACWRLILSGGLAVLLLIGVLLPSAAGRIAGYQVEALRQEQQRLMSDRSALEIEEARLLTPARLEEIAHQQRFVDPPPETVIYLNAKGGTLAMNLKK